MSIPYFNLKLLPLHNFLFKTRTTDVRTFLFYAYEVEYLEQLIFFLLGLIVFSINQIEMNNPSTHSKFVMCSLYMCFSLIVTRSLYT